MQSDWFPYDGPDNPLPTITCREVTAENSILGLVRKAMQATPQHMSDEDLIAAARPKHRQAGAKQSLALFMASGRTDDDQTMREAKRLRDNPRKSATQVILES